MSEVQDQFYSTLLFEQESPTFPPPLQVGLVLICVHLCSSVVFLWTGTSETTRPFNAT
jgi:ACR3 family arsenite efflux pump ArsB